MTERAIHRDPEGMAKLLSNPELHQQFHQLATLPEAELIAFLDMLEKGIPKDIKRLVGA